MPEGLLLRRGVGLALPLGVAVRHHQVHPARAAATRPLLAAATALGLGAGYGLGLALPYDSSQPERVGLVAGSAGFLVGAVALDYKLHLSSGEGLTEPGAMTLAGAMVGGVLAAVIAMVCWGFGDFLIQRFARRIGDWESLFYISLFGAIVILPFIYGQLHLLLSNMKGLALLAAVG